MVKDILKQHENLNLEDYRQFIPQFQYYSGSMFEYESIFERQIPISNDEHRHTSPHAAILQREQLKLDLKHQQFGRVTESMSPLLTPEELVEKLNNLPFSE
jgi:hypothetical protein